RTTDLYIPDMPHLVIYPEGISRNGQTPQNPLQWTSKYGSVVVTEFNSNTASDGINEQGLAVHLLYLDGSQYETRNVKLPGLSNLLWAQYMLDNFKTVDEALANLDKYQIEATTLKGRQWPIHIALEDATGDSAIIEYINGKPVIHHGAQYRVMTNEPAYDTQLANLKNYKLFGGTLPMPGDIDPLARFVRASSYLKTLPTPKNETQALADALAVIRTTMVPFGAEDTSGSTISTDTWPTRWVSLGDLTNKIYYFNSTDAPNIVWVDLNKINFAKDNKVLIIDPADPELVGEINEKFMPK
ncbi:MAG: linear amide C-N hydrolase, partial [Gammaproteobacteria bacterium]